MRKKIADVGKRAQQVSRDFLGLLGLAVFASWIVHPLRVAVFVQLPLAIAFLGCVIVYKIRFIARRAGQGVSARSAAPRRKPAPAPTLRGLPPTPDASIRARVLSVRFVPPPEMTDVQSALVNLGYPSRMARDAAMTAAKAGNSDFERMFARAIAELRRPALLRDVAGTLQDAFDGMEGKAHA